MCDKMLSLPSVCNPPLKEEEEEEILEKNNNSVITSGWRISFLMLLQSFSGLDQSPLHYLATEIYCLTLDNTTPAEITAPHSKRAVLKCTNGGMRFGAQY